MVTSSCFLRSERWKLEEKREGPRLMQLSAPTFLAWHFECACQMASKLEIYRSFLSESNKVLTGNTQLLSRISYLSTWWSMDKWKNSNFPWFWQVGTYSLGSAQCHIQGQVIGAGLKTITEIGNKGLHIVTVASFDWVQISIFSCPPNSGHGINIIFGSFEGSTFFCLPTFWSTFGGWVNRCFRWRVQWIERYSSDSWNKNHMSKLPPKHHHPKNSTQRSKNIIKNLRCDGIEQWNFNQPPTTPGVPPATILTGSLFVKWLRWYERDHHVVSMCTATWCILQGWNYSSISVFRNGWSCSV